MVAQQAKMSNIQLELLKMYANNVSDNDLSEIKELLIDFFAQKITKNAAQIWEEKGYTDAFFLEQHLRTPYKQEAAK
jgi:hypothetical protein